MPYHHGDLARAIIRVARLQLREVGGEPLSIRAIAREVGVSPNAPYRHFANREALLRAVAAAGYRDACRRLARESGSAGVARVWGDLASDEPALVDLMTSAPAGAIEDADLQAAIAEWLGEVARAIEPAIEGDDPGRVVEQAVACWAAVHGLTSLRRSGVLSVIDDWLLPDPVELSRRMVGG